MTATCTSMAECAAHDGETVEVVGTYRVWDPLPFRAASQPPAQQVVIELDGEEGPYLGAWGYDDHFRPLDEIARLDGRRVRVAGTFLSAMPPHPSDPPEAASMAGPCIHPVESVLAVD
ncbi:hypothetical protein [Thalassiella azotivora]